MTEPEDSAPTLTAQTLSLGQMLKAISDRDPVGTPSTAAIAAFGAWLSEAGPEAREPAYFRDVAEQYDPAANTNRDLFHLFDMLSDYLTLDEPEEEESGPPRTFIGLPMA